MLKTRLIFIDGITGSGKSCTAHFLQRQLLSNEVSVKWFSEEDINHPLGELVPKIDETDAEYALRIIADYPQKWENFVEQVELTDKIYIIESYLFQNALLPLMMNNIGKKRINDFAHRLISICSDLDPILIFLYPKNVELSLKRIWKSRGKNWKRWFVNVDESCGFSISNKTKGEEASVFLWSEINKILHEIFSSLLMRKLALEIDEQTWNIYRKKITGFLEIEYMDPPKNSLLPEICGEYVLEKKSGKDKIIKIYLQNQMLFIDAFWSKLKVVPMDKTRFTIEGFAAIFRYDKEDRFIFVEESTEPDFSENDVYIKKEIKNAKGI